MAMVWLSSSSASIITSFLRLDRIVDNKFVENGAIQILRDV